MVKSAAAAAAWEAATVLVCSNVDECMRTEASTSVSAKWRVTAFL